MLKYKIKENSCSNPVFKWMFWLLVKYFHQYSTLEPCICGDFLAPVSLSLIEYQSLKEKKNKIQTTMQQNVKYEQKCKIIYQLWAIVSSLYVYVIESL